MTRVTYTVRALRLWTWLNHPLTSRELADALGCSIWTTRRVCLGLHDAGLLEPVDETRGRASYRPTAHALSAWPKVDRWLRRGEQG